MLPDVLPADLVASFQNRPAPTLNRADARAVAEDYEAYFLTQMIEVLQEGRDQTEPFGGGAGETTFRSFLSEQYAKEMVRAGGIGLADQLTAEILRLQEAGSTQNPET